jgi:ABC-type branched-subunit amino acid transport system permease subunit
MGDKALWDMLLGNLWMAGVHWLLGFCVGAFLFWWISTILSKSSLFQKRVGVFSTCQFSLLVALLCAVVVHILEDFILDKF